MTADRDIFPVKLDDPRDLQRWLRARLGAITQGGGGISAHDLLDSTAHPDTTTGTVARGDLVAGQGASPSWTRLPIGSSGRVLKSDGTDVAWGQVALTELSGTPTRGDVISAQGVSPAWTRLALGSSGRVLKSDGTDAAWGQVALSELSGSVTRGDIITGQGGSPAWTRLGLGSSGKVLKSDGTDASWGQVAFSELTGSLAFSSLTGTADFATQVSGVESATGELAYKLYNTTSNGSQTELFRNGTSTQLTFGNNKTWSFQCMVTARRTDATGGNGAWKLEGIIYRDANAASTAILGGVVKTVLAKSNSAWDVVALADTTNGTLTFKVTGEAAKTIKWVASVTIVEAS